MAKTSIRKLNGAPEASPALPISEIGAAMLFSRAFFSAAAAAAPDAMNLPRAIKKTFRQTP
ncbi:hypothetical protein [Variovorax sp. DXTD-1]|uniref:hypothetical protein n=1 Tax=Variovorax sp. DXTD-1 TaxID=2495592 RepID=UPI000F85C54F|nr:hypothetical protein [Variovorax sp. DXTD-1]RST48552.1 hypothetical protein EJI00_16915 [Variovorax sp. DXTD-1]